MPDSLPLAHSRRFVEMPDAWLAGQARAGDQAAFGELVARYQDRIYTLVFGKAHSREDALDLTQEVFIKAYRKLPYFREDASFYTWLYRIALNTCIDFARRRSRTPEPYSLEGEILTQAHFEPEDARPGSDPERALLNQEMGSLVRAWIHDLPEPMRSALVLHDIEGLQQQEIAAIMECPLGTVKSRIQRAREELRARLRTYHQGEAVPSPSQASELRPTPTLRCAA